MKPLYWGRSVFVESILTNKRWTPAHNFNLKKFGDIGNIDQIQYWYIESLTIGTVEKVSLFRVILVRIFSAFSPYSEINTDSEIIGRDTPYLSVLSPNAGKYGKNAEQNNFEYRHFLSSVETLMLLSSSMNF